MNTHYYNDHHVFFHIGIFRISYQTKRGVPIGKNFLTTQKTKCQINDTLSFFTVTYNNFLFSNTRRKKVNGIFPDSKYTL